MTSPGDEPGTPLWGPLGLGCQGPLLCGAGSWFASGSLAEGASPGERRPHWPGLRALVIFRLCSPHPLSRRELPRGHLGDLGDCVGIFRPLPPAFSPDQLCFCLVYWDPIGEFVCRVSSTAGEKLMVTMWILGSGQWAACWKFWTLLWDPSPRQQQNQNASWC